jgi:hypothetical protein
MRSRADRHRRQLVSVVGGGAALDRGGFRNEAPVAVAGSRAGKPGGVRDEEPVAATGGQAAATGVKHSSLSVTCERWRAAAGESRSGRHRPGRCQAGSGGQRWQI